MNFAGKTLILIAPVASQLKVAKGLGLKACVIWDEAGAMGRYEAMVADVKDIADEYVECDLRDPNCLLESIHLLSEKIDGDYELYFGGMDQYFHSYYQVGRRLGKIRNEPRTVGIFSDKKRLRTALSSHPSFQINCDAVHSCEELRKALKKRSGPVILKPAQSSGSQNIHLIRTACDERNAIEAYSKVDGQCYMVEEFFEGVQFSVEAFSNSGKHQIIGLTEKFPVLPPFFVETGGVFPAQISTSDRSLIEKATSDFLNLTGLQDGATHTELILSGNRVVIVESHLRAGGLIPFLVEAAYGISLHEITIRALYEQDFLIVKKFEKVAILGIVNFEIGKVLESIEGREDVARLPSVKTHNVWAKLGHQLKVPECNLDRHGYVVVSGSDFSEAKKNLEVAQQTLKPRYRKVDYVK